jgi:hypothetical protein
MKKSIILLFITTILLAGLIYVDCKTIISSQNRVVEEKSISEIKTEDKNGSGGCSTCGVDTTIEDTAITEKEENKFTNKELLVLSISTTLIIVIVIMLIVTRFYTRKFDKKKLTMFSFLFLIGAPIFNTISITYSDQRLINSDEIDERIAVREASMKVSENKKISNENISTDSVNKIGLLITNKATVTGSKLNITKTGNSTDKEASYEYGLNSALLINGLSNVSIKNSLISTSSGDSVGVITTSLGSMLDIRKTSISTLGDDSSALVCTNGGSITGDILDVNTSGRNSSAIRGEGNFSTIKLTNSSINTNGYNSDLIISDSVVNLDTVRGAATNGDILNVKDSSEVLIINSELAGNRIYNYNDELDEMVTNSVTIKNSSLTFDSRYNKFDIYNSNSIYNLENVTISDNQEEYQGSFINLSNSTVKFTITDGKVNGNITSDKDSSLRINLNNSTFKGTVNSDNRELNVSVTLDANSKWILTGDAYVKSLSITRYNLNQLKYYINSNGYDIYYDVENNEWLGGLTINLPGGGTLIPVN